MQERPTNTMRWRWIALAGITGAFIGAYWATTRRDPYPIRAVRSHKALFEQAARDILAGVLSWDETARSYPVWDSLFRLEVSKIMKEDRVIIFVFSTHAIDSAHLVAFAPSHPIEMRDWVIKKGWHIHRFQTFDGRWYYMEKN